MEFSGFGPMRNCVSVALARLGWKRHRYSRDDFQQLLIRIVEEAKVRIPLNKRGHALS
jgi:hypothetical protein